MNFPQSYQYTKSHEWVLFLADGTAKIGLTDYAQDQLGDLVFVNLPMVEGPVTAGEAFGDVESVKAVADVLSPVTGKVCQINEALLDAPESINSDPYGAWFIQVEGIEEKEELLDAFAYEAYLRTLED